MMRIILALALAAMLAGCSTTGIKPADPPRLDAPAPQLMVDCRLPTTLPAGEMSQRDIERYWGLDRKHQLECAKRHGALRDFIVDRDGAITGKTK